MESTIIENKGTKDEIEIDVRSGKQPDQLPEGNASEAPAHHLNYRTYRIIKTAVLTTAYAAQSMPTYVIGIGLPDLRARLGFTVQQMAQVVSVQSLGVMAGSLIGGAVNDRLKGYSDAVLSAALFLCAATLVAQPWTPVLPVLGTLYFLVGLGTGAIDPVTSYSIFNLWGDKADTPMYILHFGWVIGSALVPPILSPFLTPILTDVNISTHLNFSTTLNNTSSIWHPKGDTIHEGYAVISAILLSVSIILLMFQCCIKPPKRMTTFMQETKSLRHILSPGACAENQTGFATFMIIVSIMFYMFLQGNVNGQHYLFSYVTESDLAFTNSEAVRFEMMIRITTVVSRLVLIFAGYIVPVHIILILCLSLYMVSATILAVWASTISTGIWVCLIIQSLLTAPLWPGMKVFISKHMKVTALLVALHIIGSGIGGFLYDILYGYLYDNEGKRSIFYVKMINIIAMFLIVMCMVIVAKLVQTCKLKEKGEKVGDVKPDEDVSLMQSPL